MLTQESSKQQQDDLALSLSNVPDDVNIQSVQGVGTIDTTGAANTLSSKNYKGTLNSSWSQQNIPPVASLGASAQAVQQHQQPQGVPQQSQDQHSMSQSWGNRMMVAPSNVSLQPAMYSTHVPSAAHVSSAMVFDVYNQGSRSGSEYPHLNNPQQWTNLQVSQMTAEDKKVKLGFVCDEYFKIRVAESLVQGFGIINTKVKDSDMDFGSGNTILVDKNPPSHFTVPNWFADYVKTEVQRCAPATPEKKWLHPLKRMALGQSYNFCLEVLKPSRQFASDPTNTDSTGELVKQSTGELAAGNKHHRRHKSKDKSNSSVLSAIKQVTFVGSLAQHRRQTIDKFGNEISHFMQPKSSSENYAYCVRTPIHYLYAMCSSTKSKKFALLYFVKVNEATGLISNETKTLNGDLMKFIPRYEYLDEVSNKRTFDSFYDWNEGWDNGGWAKSQNLVSNKLQKRYGDPTGLANNFTKSLIKYKKNSHICRIVDKDFILDVDGARSNEDKIRSFMYDNIKDIDVKGQKLIVHAIKIFYHKLVQNMHFNSVPLTRASPEGGDLYFNFNFCNHDPLVELKGGYQGPKGIQEDKTFLQDINEYCGAKLSLVVAVIFF